MTEIQINQTKGQLEASINKVESFLNEEEFREYNDAIYTCITYINLIKGRINKTNNETIEHTTSSKSNKA